MHTLAVTTFNLRVDTKNDLENRWDLRKHLALQTIRDLDPDILGTQEPLPHQVRYVEESLAGYTRIGTGRVDGQDKGEFSPLHLRNARLDILDSGQFWLSPTPQAVGSVGWDAALSRIATWARANDRLANRRLTLINTHFDHMGQQARVESSRLLQQWLASTVPEDPVILLGDFNSFEESEQIQLLLNPAARPQLFDAYRTMHPLRQKDESTMSRYTGLTEGSRIDFIFHSSHFTPTAASIVRTHDNGRYPSDHYPLTTTLAWK